MAALLPDHVWEERLDGPVVRQNVDGKGVLDGLVGEFEHRFAADDPCVVDQDVHGADLLAHSMGSAVDSLTITHVHRVSFGGESKGFEVVDG